MIWNRPKDDIEAEIEDFQNGMSLLVEAVKIAKTALDVAKRAFDEEAKKPENSKAQGQPVRDLLESIMKENWHLHLHAWSHQN
jgi:hypothetical protein